MNNNIYYSKNHISSCFKGISRKTLLKYLKDLPPDGEYISRNKYLPGYSIQYVKSYLDDKYYKFNSPEIKPIENTSNNNELPNKIMEADLSWKKERAKQLQIIKYEKLNELTPITWVAQYYRYITTKYNNMVLDIFNKTIDKYPNINEDEYGEMLNGIYHSVMDDIQQYENNNSLKPNQIWADCLIQELESKPAIKTINNEQ